MRRLESDEGGIAAADAARILLEDETMTERQFVRDFSEIGATDVPLVGGKNASLGEMFRELRARRAGAERFAVTADAYRHVLEQPASLDELRRSSTAWTRST